MVIYKYELADGLNIKIPKEAKFIKYEAPFVWAIVNPNLEIENFICHIIGTGWEDDKLNDYIYLGTSFSCGGLLVWHCFLEKV